MERKKNNKKKVFSIFLLFIMGLLFISNINATLEINTISDWSFDIDGSDSTPNNYDIAIIGATSTSEGKINGAYSYDGSNDYSLINNANLLGSEGSINLWFNADTKSGTDFISTSSAGSNTRDYIYIVDGDLNFGICDVGTISTGININTSQWYMTTLTWDNGDYEVYVDGVSKGSGTYTCGGSFDSYYSLGAFQQSGGSIMNWFDGKIDEVALFDKKINVTEVLTLFNSNQGIQYPYSVKSNVEQTYSQVQLSDIAINDTTWHSILDINFTVSQNDSPNYGEVIAYIYSNTDNLTVTCDTKVNNVSASEFVNITLDNGELNSIDVLRNISNLEVGEYNIVFECKNDIIGSTIIGSTVGIGHILKTSTGEILNYKNINSDSIVNSGSTSTSIASTTFTTNEDLNGNKYLLVDWSSKIENQLTSPQTYTNYLGISSLVESIDCEENEQYIDVSGSEWIGGICILKVSPSIEYTINLYGTGINTNYESNLIIKEFDYTSINEINSSILTGDTISSTSFVEKDSTQLIQETPNGQTIIKGSISTSSSINEVLFGKIIVENDVEGIIYETEEIQLTTSTNKNSLIFQAIIPTPTGTNTFKTYLKSTTGNNINIDSGSINVYVTQKLDAVENTFDIKAFEFWDNTQLSNFSAVIGGTTYSTTGNTINAIGQTTFQDILINKQSYLSKIYSQHDTETNLNATIGQYKADFKIFEKFTNNSINNFTLQTNVGDFTTTNGLITIYPLQDIYTNWNITPNNYYTQNGLEFQIGESYELFETNDFIDTLLTFKDDAGAIIYPVCTYGGFSVINTSTHYDVAAQQSDDLTLTCRLPGYNSFIGNLTSLTYPQDIIKNMNRTEINVRVYDRTTNNLITTSTTLTLIGPSGGEEATTTTGLKTFKDITFDSGTYQILASNSNYNTEIVYFEYDNEATITQDIYMVPTSSTDTTVVTIVVRDTVTNFISGAIVKVQEWKPLTSTFVTVSQQETDTNGEAQLTVEKGTKVYRFSASKDGVSEETTNKVIYNDDTQFTLTLEDVATIVPDQSIDIITFTPTYTDLGNNQTKVDLAFKNTKGQVNKFCLGLYEVVSFSRNLLSEKCDETAEGSVLMQFEINKSFTQQVLFTAYDLEGTQLKQETGKLYEGTSSIANWLQRYNLHYLLPLLGGLIALTLGMITRGPARIYVVCITIIILTWTMVPMVPDLITKNIAAVITVMCLLMIWGGRK